MLSRALAATMLAATLTVIGFTTENVTIVYWTKGGISQFGVLLSNILFFPISFGLILVGLAVHYKDYGILRVADDPAERKLFTWGRSFTLAQIAAFTGFLNMLNGFLIVYASPPDNTPPLVQAVVQNSGVLFSIPFSKYLLGDNKRYLSREALLAAGLIVASVTISILPTIIEGQASKDFNGGDSIAWCVVYLLGLAPGAGYNVMQQLYLIRAGVLTKDVTNREIAIASTRILFYSSVGMMCTLFAMFWVDILPWFGTSSTMDQFAANTAFSVTCSLGGPDIAVTSDYVHDSKADCPSHTPAFAFSFMFGYLIVYFGSAYLNRESATFNMLMSVLVTMCTSAFWYIPGTNPNAENTPLWSVLLSLFLSIGGLVLWKWWESKTPSHEQFDLAAKRLHKYDDDSETSFLLDTDGQYVVDPHNFSSATIQR